MAGKGDKPRPVNKSKYNENFDKIKWSKSIKPTLVKEKNGVKIFSYKENKY